MQLSDHFSLDELCFSSTAQRRGIDNLPRDEAIIVHLGVLAGGLEKVRALLGQPMHIDSGYRCVALNNAVHGASNSAHLSGYAADFICPGFGDPLAIVHAITAAGLAFDQVIFEGTWVHISFDPRLRGQVLTAHFGTGVTTYTAGA